MWLGKSKVIGVVLAAALLFGGCSAKEESLEAASRPDESTNIEETASKYTFLEEQNFVWKDNSLDDLQAVFNLPIEEVKAEGEQFGGTLKYFAHEGGAVRFKNHLLGYKKSWGGVSGIDMQGVSFAGMITVEPEDEGILLDIIGPVAGQTEYIAYRDMVYEGGNGGMLYYLNEKYEKMSEISINEPLGDGVYAIAADLDGYIHVLKSEAAGFAYSVFSPDGVTLCETICGTAQLCPLEDGRVIVGESIANENNQLEKWLFFETDIEKGVKKELASLPMQAVAHLFSWTIPPYITMKSDTELVWCSNEGIYLYNAVNESLTLVYKWAHHGITPEEIKSIYAKTDGTIGVIYKDAEGIQYTLLKPTFEDTEIKAITFAVSPYNKDTYRSAVAAFNKKYPIYNIELKDDYEETALLTQLGSGAGPVLIDTTITGFDALEKLWQPLDGYLEESGLAAELIPQALSFGQIGDITYGIAMEFVIRTLVVKDNTLQGWDYDRFLQAIEDFPGVAFSYEHLSSPSDSRWFYFNSLQNGLQDTAYLDLNEGTTIFGTPRFKRILKLAEKAGLQLPADGGKTLAEGKTLCEIVHVSSIKDLVTLRMRMENEKLFTAGYPLQNGGRNLLQADYPITIRSTATDEEKQMAYSFFKILLSHDRVSKLIENNAIGTSFSVRKDILEEQITHYERIYKYDNNPKPDRNKELALYQMLLENSTVEKSFPADLQSVFDEELDEYLEGIIPGELFESRLKSRVELYLDEIK